MRLISTRSARGCSYAALVAVVCGCGASGPPTHPVNGAVSFTGQPLSNGTMTFIPDSPSARTTVTKIVAGRYDAELTEGSWTVNIQAVRETGPVIPALREAPREQFIPAKYNRQSTLTVSVPVEQSAVDFNLEL